MNEEYVEKLKNFEKVVTSQHASLEYDAHSSGIFTTESISEKGLSPNGQQTEQNDSNEELTTVRKMVAVLTEKNVELENECQQLRDNLEKSKLIDRSKEEMINSLRKEITSYQQSDISNHDSASAEMLQIEIDELKTKLDRIDEENNSLKCRVAEANEKLSALEISLRQKDDELCTSKMLLENEQREAQSQIENVKNSVQFELDECKIKMDEMAGRIDHLTEQLSTKDKEADILTDCIGRLCGELDERNVVISRVLMDNEEGTDNIADAVVAATNLRRKETGALPQIDGCPQHSKEKILLLLERIEQTTDNNVVLLRKLETLTEVISRKDALIEETIEEKEALRNEFQESMRQKANELSQLENKYVDLDKVSFTNFL